tara:strand:+ start:557 stop:748 length:192 start_codon:yes stop_codon:yes gene_type:complete
VINLKMIPEEANALRYALFLHTKDDSDEFPSLRVQLLRGIINRLDIEIERDFEERQNESESTD